jgi:hypothetical protein
MSDWSKAISARAAGGEGPATATISGNRGLQIEERLIFEEDMPGRCGVDLPEPPAFRDRLGGLARTGSASRRSCGTTRGLAKRTTRLTPGSIPWVRAR